MKTSSCKAKGRTLQKYIVSVLVRLAKVLEPDDVVSRPMGSGGTDILLSPKAQKVFPISIESKNTKSFPSLKALEQSDYNKYKGTIAAVVWKPPGKGYDKSIIYFNYEQFVDWMLNKEAQDAESN